MNDKTRRGICPASVLVSPPSIVSPYSKQASPSNEVVLSVRHSDLPTSLSLSLPSFDFSASEIFAASWPAGRQTKRHSRLPRSSKRERDGRIFVRVYCLH